jgi:Zn-dependent peptidase ImmA (M78 family)
VATTRQSGLGQEQEANRFAADVLMPPALLELAHAQMPDSGPLAHRFGVSEVAMGYRLINLGLAQP